MVETPARRAGRRRDRRGRRLLQLRHQRPHPDDVRLQPRRRRSRMMPAYLEQGLLKRNPFETIDQAGVGELVRIGAERGARPSPASSSASAASTAATPSRSPCSTTPASTTSAARRSACRSPVWRPRRRSSVRPPARRDVTPGATDRRTCSADTVCACGRLIAPTDPARGRAEDGSNFVDLAVEPWHWAVLLGIVLTLLLVDLLVLAPGGPRRQDARGGDRVGRVGLDRPRVLLLVWAWFSGTATTEYLSGYLVEQSLSIDNVFVWAIILSFFAVPGDVPAPGAVLGHLRRARAAGDVHLRRRRADRALRLGALRLRRLLAVHRGAPAAVRRRRPGRSGRRPVPEARQPRRADDAALLAPSRCGFGGVRRDGRAVEVPLRTAQAARARAGTDRHVGHHLHRRLEPL